MSRERESEFLIVTRDIFSVSTAERFVGCHVDRLGNELHGPVHHDKITATTVSAAPREIRAIEDGVADIAGRRSFDVVGSGPRIHFDIRRAFAEIVSIVGAPGGETTGGDCRANRNAVYFGAGKTLNAVMQLAGGESFAHSVGEISEHQLVIFWILPPVRVSRVSGFVGCTHVAGISQVDRGYESAVARFVEIRFTGPDDIAGLL